MIRKKIQKAVRFCTPDSTALGSTVPRPTPLPPTGPCAVFSDMSRQTQAQRRPKIRLHDVLAHLSPNQAQSCLGPRGKQLLLAARRHEVDLEAQVTLNRQSFRLRLDEAVVTLRHSPRARGRLQRECSACRGPCEHVATALWTVLDNKVELGLALPPEDPTNTQDLSEAELHEQALEERVQRASKERMRVQAHDPKRPWTSYQVTSGKSGQTYRVELRGKDRGASFCSCPDFRKNTLGTCKHILHVLRKLKRKFSAAQLARPYQRKRPSLHIEYGTELSLRLRLPQRCDPGLQALAADFDRSPVTPTAIRRLIQGLRAIEQAGHDVLIYPDAEELLDQVLRGAGLRQRCAAIRKAPKSHPLRKNLLEVELLPYQLDGIAFCAAAGRAILADDMGLGKTIQAIGTAEFLARYAGISRVLVVCPASVKSQWLGEIQRFCQRSAHTVLGPAARRAEQYASEHFFTVCNYEQVLRDRNAIEAQDFDLIVLDEAQRIKNWETQTAKVIKTLVSPYALVLTGTPLENRIDELYSLVEFIDERRLGPDFRFYHRHRQLDERGKISGYKNLAELRETLAPILLRRTRDQVVRQLPERSTEIVRVRPTEEQLEIHSAQMRTVNSIVRKPWLSEVDLLRLQKALLLCRMAANGTYLVDKEHPGHSTKLPRLAELCADLLAEPDRKIVLFSEWTTMLDEIERVLAPTLRRHKAGFVRLDGKVPQQKRQQLVRAFRDDPDCRLFLTTNAGSTGLNLQAANTVVNVDLPWNPALLEQRIGRAHRMGQKRRVQVYLLVTEDTIEENMLQTLSAKHELFQAVLDPDSKVDELEMQTGMAQLKQRLEVLLGNKPESPVDASQQQRVEASQREIQAADARVAEASGRMISAAFEVLGELLGRGSNPDPKATQAIADKLRSSVRTDDQGRPSLQVTLPDTSALDRLAQALASLTAS